MLSPGLKNPKNDILEVLCDNIFCIDISFLFLNMKHISILVPEGGCSVANIEVTHQIFLRVNDYLADSGRSPGNRYNREFVCRGRGQRVFDE